MEIDAFAQEIARLSLMLADYPSRNGWDLRQRDVFNAPDLSLSLSNASVVLCNPPFEQVPMEERPGYELQMPNQAAEILSRVLQASPALIGFVLPQAFRDGTQFRAVRRKLAETYGALDVIELPDRTFSHSDVGSTLFAEASWRRSWRSCNKFKSSATHGMDPDMSKIVPLFDPRKHEWDEHFRMDIDAFEIIGRGPSGRATVVRLRVNRPKAVQARMIWLAYQAVMGVRDRLLGPPPVAEQIVEKDSLMMPDTLSRALSASPAPWSRFRAYCRKVSSRLLSRLAR